MKNALVILLTIVCVNIYAQNGKFENLVFEGAGIRGIAYGGVISQLEQQGVISQIKKVGGTSAGAITALMLSLGYNSKDIYNIIASTKFQKFNDGEMFFLGGICRVNNRYGWYKGDKFNQWLENIIEAKTGNPNITFSELSKKGYKELYVTATCLNKQKLIVFSAENYPNMKIKNAVRASMSIPLYFEAVFIDSLGETYKNRHSNKKLDIVVDGGITGNFPIFIFDSYTTDSLNHIQRIPNYKTIGVRIDSDDQIARDTLSKELAYCPIENVTDYLQAFYIYTLENLNRNILIPEDWPRTISVSSAGIGPRVKKLTKEQKEALVKSGENGTIRYFELHKTN